MDESHAEEAQERYSASTPAYLGPVTSTYTVRNTERYPLSILPFGVTAMRAAVGQAVGHLHTVVAGPIPIDSFLV